MQYLKEQGKILLHYVLKLLQWLLIATVIGIVGGFLGSVFHLGIDFVTEARTKNGWLVLFLPLGGLFIAAVYGIFQSKGKLDTNRVIDAVNADEKVPFVMTPLVFIGTLVTHLFGGSAGREGAALQLGGSLGYNLGKICRLNKKDLHTVVMAGMSGVFAALFGTPLTAAFFAIEVACVGVMHYASLVPCIVSALTAHGVASIFGITPVYFPAITLTTVSFSDIGKIIVLAVLCALVGVLFCTTVKWCKKFAKKYVSNQYLRGFLGGCLILLLTIFVGTQDYNGAGMHIISRAMAGEARYEAFLLKIVFTAITIAAGFKGGEIVPSFFIGSTFGCVVGELLGLHPGFAAAIGFITLFCAVVNCPVASMILALEVFGSQNILIFALVCGIGYMMSGHSSLYNSQKIMHSKLGEVCLDVLENKQ